MQPLTSSCGTLRRMAALPPISDHTKGTTTRSPRRTELTSSMMVHSQRPSTELSTGSCGASKHDAARVATTPVPFSDSVTLMMGASRLHGALRACVDCIERGRAADVQSISLLTAKTQVGDCFRNVNLT